MRPTFHADDTGRIERPNGEPWLQSGRRLCRHALAATGATAAEQAYLGYV
jgi:hypothetical protein